MCFLFFIFGRFAAFFGRSNGEKPFTSSLAVRVELFALLQKHHISLRHAYEVDRFGIDLLRPAPQNFIWNLLAAVCPFTTPPTILKGSMTI
jgi:hypothetical protein